VNFHYKAAARDSADIAPDEVEELFRE
jgi:hypothetical protein